MIFRHPLIFVLIILVRCCTRGISDDGETPMKADKIRTEEAAVNSLEQISLSIRLRIVLCIICNCGDKAADDGCCVKAFNDTPIMTMFFFKFKERLFTVGWNAFNKGRLLEDEEKYVQAIEYYTKAIDTSEKEDRQVFLVVRGECYLKMGRLDEAISDYRAALETGTVYQENRTRLIELLFESGKVDEAELEFKLLDPDEYFEKMLNNLCSTPEFQRDVLRMCDEAKSEKLENSTYYHSGLAYCYTKMGTPETAISHWREALKYNPERQDIRSRLIDQLLDARKYEDVVDESLFLDSFYDFKSLGQKLLSFKAFDAAIRFYTELLIKYPEDEEITYYYSERADCYKYKGDLNNAISDWQNSINFNHRREDVRWRLIGALFDTGRYAEAVEQATLGHRDNKKDVQQLALKLCTVKASEEALRLFDNVLKILMTSYSYYKHLGRCFMKMGDMNKAGQLYKVAAEKTFVKYNEHALFCEELLKYGNIDEAMEEFSLLNLSLLEPYNLAKMGDRLLAKRKLDESLICYTKAIENAEEKERYYKKRGIYYKTINEIQKAIQDFREGCKVEETEGVVTCCIELVQILFETEEYEAAEEVLESITAESLDYVTREDAEKFYKIRENIEDRKKKHYYETK